MAFPSFSTPQQQPPSSIFQQQNNPFSQQQQQQQQYQSQQQQQQQQLFLFTNEKVPATYGTKWADLHPDSQKILRQIEDQVLEYRDESQRLDQCSRLHDSSLSNDGFELDTSHVIQELGGISTAMEREKAVLHELMVVAKDMLRNTEVAVRSFMILHPRFIHPKPGVETTPMPETAVFDFYSGLPKKPSPFMVQTIARFGKYLGECRQWIEELEQLLLLDSETNSSSSLLQSLPQVILNVHHFFVHVAAKVEMIHQYIESMKMAYLADQKRRGDGNNPFLEADRRETAKQEAAAKRVHPTLHLPAPTQAAAGGLCATPSTVPSQTSTSAAAAGGGSLFGTTMSAPSTAATSLFATPAATSAPASSIFGASPQTPVLGSAPTGSLFGSASTPSLFPTANSSFGSTASAGNSLFSTPFATGAATGLVSSFGAASKQSRPKTRNSRR